MKLIGTALAGIYVVVATRSASATPEAPDVSTETKVVPITCASGKKMESAVSQPDTAVKVTFPDVTSSLREDLEASKNYIYDASCSRPEVLSNICPGATVSAAPQDGGNVGPGREEAMTTGLTVTLVFPQLPPSQQVVCVKCPEKSSSKNTCEALITVAAASPQGPQACAIGGTSITLEINEAGGSAQFKCKKDWTLAPTKLSEAYADDCSKVEPLKDMTRSDKSDSGYVTVKADKLKKKTLCYLCQPSKSVDQRTGGKDDPCKVYVQVSGSTKFSSSVPYGFALPCLAAMLRFS